VRYVLDGSLRRASDKIRVNVQLIDASDGRQIWGDRYDRPTADLFNLQDELVRAIVGQLAKHLEKAEVQKLRRKPPESLQAYELWLAGAERHELGTAEAHAEARALYEKALAIDPGFARAHAGLAELCYMAPLISDWGLPQEANYGQALEHARMAVELDGVDAHSHLSLAWALMVHREFERARMHLQMAGDLNPNDADIAMSRATAKMFLGEPAEGLAIAAQALRLNPFCPDWYLSDKAVIHFGMRDYGAALAIYDSMGELYPHSTLWHAAAAAHAGRRSEAGRLVEQFIHRARALWAGDAAASPADYARWVISGLPIRREEDVEHLRAGLREAGLPL
jgi:tetratricopeptide (TPR) repeat protein